MSISQHEDIVALEAMPLAQYGLPNNSYDAIRQTVQRVPRQPALSFFLQADRLDRVWTWTYQQLFADITRAANVFHHLGVGKNDVIAFVLPNLPETHFTIWGGEAAGRVMAINPLLEGAQIAELIRTSRAKVLVTLAPTPKVDLWDKIRAQLGQMPEIQTLVWVNMARYVGIKGLALRYLAMHEQHSLRNLNVVDLVSAMQQQPADRLVSGRVIHADEPSSYFCTGGTTGLPKIAVRRHGNEVFNAWAVKRLFGEQEERPRQLFCGLPLFHVNGQLVTGLMPWMRGDHVILGTPQGYRGQHVVKNFWQIVEKFKINLFSGVPTLYAALLEQPINHDISSLEYAICGAAPMPMELFSRFEQQVGVPIIEGYGLTEGTCVSALNPIAGSKRIGSIGLRLPWQAMKAVLLDEHGQYVRDAAVDEVGVLVIRGENVFLGYLNPAHNQGIWLVIGAETWLNTGDLGRQDAEGYFWLTGRKKELIIRGGHNIDPKSIEEPLHLHPAVAMAAAVGMPDAYAGELPVAYVQLSPEFAQHDPSALEQELLDFLAQHLHEKAAQPKAIRFIEQMPVTAVGKIFKPALLMQEIEAVVRREATESQAVLRSLVVQQDPKQGLVAVIGLDHPCEQLQQRLGQFAFVSLYA